jgi:Bacterial SH3 domain
MRSLVIVFLGITLSSGTAAPGRTGCSASDYAHELIALRSEPSAKGNPLQSIPRKEAASLVRLDAFGSRNGDWLKVRDGQSDGWVSAKYVVCRIPPQQAQDIIAPQAADVMRALKGADMPALAQFVHPVKGLRFSPYASKDTTDVVLTASQLVGALQDPAKRVWGADDGSGDRIRLSFARYYHKFVYDRDFAQAQKITYNNEDEQSNRARDQYPNAIVVDYCLPQTTTSAQEHLRLVFEQHQSKWYLSGIIHEGWTI